jgi:hypothetical protein
MQKLLERASTVQTLAATVRRCDPSSNDTSAIRG